jgi:hypothetical protein
MEMEGIEIGERKSTERVKRRGGRRGNKGRG